LACKIFANFPFELKKVAGNSIDATHSISRNISEGYYRRPPRRKRIPESSKYCTWFLRRISFLLYQLQASRRRKQITADDYQRLDQLHYKVENALLKLIPKALIQTLKLCVFDHYSMIPTFHHSM
jgi:hypothetical protein